MAERAQSPTLPWRCRATFSGSFTTRCSRPPRCGRRVSSRLSGKRGSSCCARSLRGRRSSRTPGSLTSRPMTLLWTRPQAPESRCSRWSTPRRPGRRRSRPRRAAVGGHRLPPAEHGAGSFWRAHPKLRAVPIRSWEIWNEPKFEIYWGGHPNAAAYAAMFRAVYPAIHAVDPHADIVTAGVANTTVGGIWRRALHPRAACEPAAPGFRHARNPCLRGQPCRRDRGRATGARHPRRRRAELDAARPPRSCALCREPDDRPRPPAAR